MEHDRIGALKSGGRGVTSGHRRLQSTLVIGEVALTVVLLIGAGLLFRTLRNMWNAQPGFQPEHLVTFKVGLDPAGSSTPAQMRIAYQQLVERIRAIPGVQSADLTRCFLSRASTMSCRSGLAQINRRRWRRRHAR